MIHILVAVGLIVLAAILAVVGNRQSNKTGKYNLYIEAASPSELAGGVPAFYGGTVAAIEGQPPLVAQYSKQPCVWYRYTLEREVRSTDSNGAQSTQWEVMSEQPPQGVLFALQANGTQVLVNPTDADVQKPAQYQDFVPMVDTTGQTGASAALGTVANVLGAMGDNRVRVREEYIPIGQQLYAGGVTVEKDGKKLFANDGTYPLVLTTQSKSGLIKSGHRASGIEYGVALALVAAAIAAFTLIKK